MPTGYTYPVIEGTITEFPDFALQCARAFGALISMRDDPSNVPIPNEIEPSDYYQKRLAESKAELARVQGMALVEVEQAAEADYAVKLQQHEDYERKEELAEQRLDAMLKKVRGWVPPTAEHQGLKDFMLDQIQISKRGAYRAKPPEKLTASEWQQGKIKSLFRDVEYNAGEHEKEVEQARGRTEWLKALRQSLVQVSEHA